MAAASWWRCCKYDVFLNFRGEDTRRGFVSHLHRALCRKSINTFIDAEELRKGHDLSQLLTAINDSRVSIVVFSQNYASSTWCLKELVQIIECMDTWKQMVVPIFYQVDPSDIRKQKRSFAEAFGHYEHDSNADMEEVRSWRSALKRATNLSGWDSRNYEDDAEFIEKIVEDIYKKLIHISTRTANDGLVEMDTHIHELESRLCLEMDCVRVVGIWGMGGIGKTTIARVVYDKFACQFQERCFQKDVKQGFYKNGELHMQAEFLSAVMNNKVRTSDILNNGFQVMLDRLGKKKVFLVIDDVDNLSQIEALLGKQPSFGGGSRIIITTRDKQLLSGVDAIYNPKGLSDFTALELFRQYAFRTNQYTRDYYNLSMRAIKYAQGLPLALKVLGAFLDNKIIPEWEDVLKKMKKIPHRGIQDVLRTSFYGLDDSERDIFLDIACFFKGMKKEYATKILDHCGFFPHIGLKVLVDRALVIISDDGVLQMHDLLEEMGWDIVRQESIKDPGERSRLCIFEDVHHVLTQNTATEAVESIVLDLSNPKEVCLNAEAFVRMTKLRLFKIYYSNCHNLCQIENLKFLSPELRCLLWPRYPLKSLPSNFHPKDLVDLDMPYSQMEQLWEGIKPLYKLESINLSHSQHLKKTPDLTKATNLEKLTLEGCISLIEVHPSISALKNLSFLTLKGCKALKVFPSIMHMESLQTLILSGCSNLEKFSEISETMGKLSHLSLDDGGIKGGIKELPWSITLTGLSTLNLENCRELKSLPDSIYMRSLETLILSGCSKLEKFPEIAAVMDKLSELHLDGTAVKELPWSINNLRGLVTLNLNNCRKLKSLPTSICIRSLQSLNLYGCPNLENFPEISEVIENIAELYLDKTAIKELHWSINNLRRLVRLSLKDCKRLKSLPSIRMRFLETLDFSGCSNIERFPEILENVELQYLYLNGTAIKELPSSIHNLTRLVKLKLNDCRELKTLPSIMDMTHLKTLILSGCFNLEKFPEISENMAKLSKLYLDGTGVEELPSSIKNLTGLVDLKLNDCKELQSLPNRIVHMKSLTSLHLYNCSKLKKFPKISENMENLSELHLDGTGIEELPSSIKNLTGLVYLKLNYCKELKSLTSSIGHMKSLQSLHLSFCSKLEKFPEISIIMEKLSELYLNGTAIKVLPCSILNLTGLVDLKLNDCKELKSLPSGIHMTPLKTLILSGCSNLEKFPEISEIWEELLELRLDGTAIKELPSSIHNLTRLGMLKLNDCRELKTLPSSIHMTPLKTLILSGCSNFEKFPEILEIWEELLELHLDGTAIKELPSSIHNLTRLGMLKLNDCRELTTLPSSIHMIPLTTLILSGCSNFEMFPEISWIWEELLELHLDGTAIKEIPVSIKNLTGLVTLNLKDCKELKTLPSSICQLKSLAYITLSGCTKFEVFPNISENMEELRELDMEGTSIIELSASIEHVQGLMVLNLRDCKSLVRLPDNMCNLACLISLFSVGAQVFLSCLRIWRT